jgi:hypothetical protein
MINKRLPKVSFDLSKYPMFQEHISSHNISKFVMHNFHRYNHSSQEIILSASATVTLIKHIDLQFSKHNLICKVKFKLQQNHHMHHHHPHTHTHPLHLLVRSWSCKKKLKFCPFTSFTSYSPRKNKSYPMLPIAKTNPQCSTTTTE